MESTGVYWIPLYQKLEEAGFEVLLVDARQVKHVPGRKSDVQDCQWLQQLHSYGLLRAAFRPEDSICRLRTLQRHRKNLVECGAMWIQHIQKALNEMNLHLHHVLTDISGQSGLAILDAILAGERDPKNLATLVPRHAISWERVRSKTSYLVGIGTWAHGVMCRRIPQPAFGIGRRLSRRGRRDQERVATQQQPREQPRGWSGSKQEYRRRKHQQIPGFFQNPISSEWLWVRPAFGCSGK
jgi:transposase